MPGEFANLNSRQPLRGWPCGRLECRTKHWGHPRGRAFLPAIRTPTASAPASKNRLFRIPRKRLRCRRNTSRRNGLLKWWPDGSALPSREPLGAHLSDFCLRSEAVLRAKKGGCKSRLHLSKIQLLRRIRRGEKIIAV